MRETDYNEMDDIPYDEYDEYAGKEVTEKEKNDEDLANIDIGGNLVWAVEDDIIDPRYESLYDVLNAAYDQSAGGKGKERHAADNNFENQIICQIQRMLYDVKHPFGGGVYQAIKKSVEAGRLYQIKGWEAGYNEILGAINYLAAVAHLMKEYGEKETADKIEKLEL